ncbi:MAG: hypothetical protein ABI867_26960 [Kofleriaceae bacterium]
MTQYRLAPLREARSRDERVKRGDLAVAVGAATATAADVAAAAARVETVRATLAAAKVTAILGTARALADRERYLARLRRDLDAAIAEHLRAEAAHAGRLERIDLARGTLVRARADREVIERHFERWRTEAKKLVERRDD